MSANYRLSARRWKLASALTMAVIATAACGTTVPTSEIPRADAGSSGLTAGSLPSTSQGGGQITGGSGPTSPITPAPNGQAPGAVSAVGPSTGIGTRPTNGPAGNNSTARIAAGPVTIGALTAQGAGDYERSLGFSGVATGDQAAMTKSVVAYINAHGGIAGHRVNVLVYDVKVADAETNPTAAYQAACAYFTQDHHVFAVASYLQLVPENFYRCLQQHHVPVDTPDDEFSASFLNRYADTVIAPISPNYTRLMADNVDALWSSGWLTASSKVGVVAFDTPAGHSSVDAGLVPALSRHGLKLADSLYTSTDNSADSQYQGGVLKFKAAGVDRVFFAIGGEPVYFALAAEQDAYHPHYELGSLEYPGVLEQDLPADQLVGAAGIGFDPYFDLDNTRWPIVHTPGEGRCLSALKAAAQDLSSGTTMGIGAWICDEWFLFQTALAKLQVLTPGSLMHAVDGLGSRFTSASTFATYFASGRPHDGASAFRLDAFQSGCNCFTYQSSTRPLP
jgi:hypothetical protein